MLFLFALLLGDPEPHYFRGVALYVDIVRGKTDRGQLDAAVAAFDCALTIDSEHFSAIVYRGLTLRQHAFREKDAKKKQALLAAADATRDRAIELVKQGKGRKVTPDPASIR